MKRLTINADKRDGAADAEKDDRQNHKRGKGENLVKDKNEQGGDEHDDKLPRGNRADNLILHINKLRDSELLHNHRLLKSGAFGSSPL